jgi:hypothetical protein
MQTIAIAEEWHFNAVVPVEVGGCRRNLLTSRIVSNTSHAMSRSSSTGRFFFVSELIENSNMAEDLVGGSQGRRILLVCGSVHKINPWAI